MFVQYLLCIIESACDLKIRSEHLNVKVLLVHSPRSPIWLFPKGKVNEAEDPVACAVREVHEETGFDMRSRLDPLEFIECRGDLFDRKPIAPPTEPDRHPEHNTDCNSNSSKFVGPTPGFSSLSTAELLIRELSTFIRLRLSHLHAKLACY